MKKELTAHCRRRCLSLQTPAIKGFPNTHGGKFYFIPELVYIKHIKLFFCSPFLKLNFNFNFNRFFTLSWTYAHWPKRVVSWFPLTTSPKTFPIFILSFYYARSILNSQFNATTEHSVLSDTMHTMKTWKQFFLLPLSLPRHSIDQQPTMLL